MGVILVIVLDRVAIVVGLGVMAPMIVAAAAVATTAAAMATTASAMAASAMAAAALAAATMAVVLHAPVIDSEMRATAVVATTMPVFPAAFDGSAEIRCDRIGKRGIAETAHRCDGASGRQQQAKSQTLETDSFFNVDQCHLYSSPMLSCGATSPLSFINNIDLGQISGNSCIWHRSRQQT